MKSFEMLPAGIFITGRDLRIKYINKYALEEIFRLDPDRRDDAGLLWSQSFYTTDRKPFDIGSCVERIVTSQEKTFQKTLILRHDKGESLLYITATGAGDLFGGTASQKNKGADISSDSYVFLAVDLSAELDCITHSPGSFGFDEFRLGSRLIGNDEKIRDIYRKIKLAAESLVNVLISGESGTGKEVVADAIHSLSDRREKPMVKVNCASLSETLLESELFGHVKGAFTGAVRDKKGKFELADGGTLFLDEIGEISQALQVKLLRVIQEKKIERVGGESVIPVDIRIIAATNRNLAELVRKGGFREDLYYRINVFSLNIPPLRERRLDIPRLCSHFIDIFNKETGKHIRGISQPAMKRMMKYNWPGNVRELRNAIEHAFVLSGKSLIEIPDLPESISGYYFPETDPPGIIDEPYNEQLKGEAAGGFTRKRGGRLNISGEELKRVLELHGWNQSETARVLGISRVALWKKIKKFGL